MQVARLAPKVLGDEATQLVIRFLKSQQNDDGGFKDRTGQSDLYYTVFGLAKLRGSIAGSNKPPQAPNHGMPPGGHPMPPQQFNQPPAPPVQQPQFGQAPVGQPPFNQPPPQHPGYPPQR